MLTELILGNENIIQAKNWLDMCYVYSAIGKLTSIESQRGSMNTDDVHRIELPEGVVTSKFGGKVYNVVSNDRTLIQEISEFLDIS